MKIGGGTPGPGRPKGMLNKATADIKALAEPYGPGALQVLVTLSKTAENEATRVAASKEILDRAYGKPAQAVIGDPEHPVALTISWLDETER